MPAVSRCTINFTICTFLTIFFSGCQKDDDGRPESIIYLAGFEYVNSYTQASYWKNGVVTKLTTGTTRADAFSIAVKGNDVFAAGYEQTERGNEVARLRQNGISPHVQVQSPEI